MTSANVRLSSLLVTTLFQRLLAISLSTGWGKFLSRISLPAMFLIVALISVSFQYYGGKLVNLPREAQGLSKIGVYPGQGSACVLVKSPCNQGFCIEEYNQFKCNCSVSAFTGPNCQLGKCQDSLKGMGTC